MRCRFGDVAIRLEARRHVPDGLLEIDDVRQELVVDLNEAERVDRRLLVVSRDRRDLVPDETNLLAEDRLLAAEGGLRRVEAMKNAAHAGKRFRFLGVDPPHTGPGIGAAQHPHMEHAGEVDVLCISGTARDTLRPVNAPARVRDLDEFRPRRRDREVLALDEDERFVDLALELLAALDDPRHQRFRFPAFTPAETMFGYAPQRQRFPATARRTSSSVGAGVSRNKATTDMIWPGVQKPHWNASASMNARCTG